MRIPKLHTLILISMFIGLALGLVLHAALDHSAPLFQTALWWLDLFGKELFIGALKMIIAPLIFASVVAGIASLPSARELGAIGGKTLFYYVSTTTLAVAVGIAAVLLVQPGTKGPSLQIRQERIAEIEAHREAFQTATGLDGAAEENAPQFRAYLAEREGAEIGSSDFAANYGRMQNAQARTPARMFLEDILRPIFSNPFHSLSGSVPNALGVISFAILVGMACILIGEPARPVAQFFDAFNAVMLRITHWIMCGAPIAIGCLVASIVAELGPDAIRSLGWYCATVIGGIAVHVCILLALVRIFGGMSPLTFIRGIREAWLIAFTTTSSAATLPVTIDCVTNKLGVSKKIGNFTLPVGATINMDGTALYEGVAVIFLIQLYGGLADVPIVMTPMTTFLIFVTAVLASVGAAAVPSAGLITMALVAGAVGLPLHYIVLIYAVDHMLDMFRTSTNVLGDAAGAVIVNRLEAPRLANDAL